MSKKKAAADKPTAFVPGSADIHAHEPAPAPAPAPVPVPTPAPAPAAQADDSDKPAPDLGPLVVGGVHAPSAPHVNRLDNDKPATELDIRGPKPDNAPPRVALTEAGEAALVAGEKLRRVQSIVDNALQHSQSWKWRSALQSIDEALKA